MRGAGGAEGGADGGGEWKAASGRLRDLGDRAADRPRQGSRGRVCTWRAPGNGIAKKVGAGTACELVSETVEGWCTHI